MDLLSISDFTHSKLGLNTPDGQWKLLQSGIVIAEGRFMRFKLALLMLAVCWHNVVLSHSKDEKFIKSGDLRLREFSPKLRSYALQQILDNIVGAKHILFDAPADSRGIYGAVIAAPSVMADDLRGEVQDYRWRWKRDAAIVMRYLARVMLDGALAAVEPARRIALADAYVQFCEREQQAHQILPNVFELGHAKVTLLAEKNPLTWGYPQNDGPPLENFALYEILKLYRAVGADPVLVQRLMKVFIRNTEYILQNYGQAQVERWEEEKANSHFSILLEMHGALRLALELGVENPSRVEHVRDVLAQWIRQRHISADGAIISNYQPWLEGSLVRDKYSGLDTQVLMSSLFLNKWWDESGERFFAPNDPHLRLTFHHLRSAFARKYHVNSNAHDTRTGEPLRGLVFGRYPEDVQHFGGAPWFITTFTAIQFVLWDAIEMHRLGKVRITTTDLPYFNDFIGTEVSKNLFHNSSAVIIGRENPLFARIVTAMVRFAKESFFRVMVHSGEREVSLTEVLNGVHGYKEGIEHLTWSSVEADKTLRLFEQAERLDLIPEEIAPLTAHCSEILVSRN